MRKDKAFFLSIAYVDLPYFSRRLVFPKGLLGCCGEYLSETVGVILRVED